MNLNPYANATVYSTVNGGDTTYIIPNVNHPNHFYSLYAMLDEVTARNGYGLIEAINLLETLDVPTIKRGLKYQTDAIFKLSILSTDGMGASIHCYDDGDQVGFAVALFYTLLTIGKITSSNMCYQLNTIRSLNHLSISIQQYQQLTAIPVPTGFIRQVPPLMLPESLYGILPQAIPVPNNDIISLRALDGKMVNVPENEIESWLCSQLGTQQGIMSLSDLYWQYLLKTLETLEDHSIVQVISVIHNGLAYGLNLIAKSKSLSAISPGVANGVRMGSLDSEYKQDWDLYSTVRNALIIFSS